MLAAALPAQGGTTLGLTPEQRELFTFLDQLVDTTAYARPFVRASLGSDVYGAHQPGRVVRHGFLLAANQASCEVRFLEGDRAVLIPTRPDPELERVAADRVDLVAYVHEVVTRLRSDADQKGGRAELPLGTTTHGLLLAHACAHRQERELLELLWAVLPAKARSLRDLGDSGIAGALANGLAIACGDGDLAWPEALRRHEVWLATFAGAHAADLVRSRRDGIRRHLDVVGQRRKGMPPTAADFVQDLADAGNLPPCPPAIFHFSPEAWPLPVPDVGPPARRQLLALGLEAVPALIDALGDTTTTRRVTRYRADAFETSTLGFVAADLLDELAGHPQPRPSGKDGWTRWYEAERTRRR